MNIYCPCCQCITARVLDRGWMVCEDCLKNDHRVGWPSEVWVGELARQVGENRDTPLLHLGCKLPRFISAPADYSRLSSAELVEEIETGIELLRIAQDRVHELTADLKILGEELRRATRKYVLLKLKRTK